MFGSFLPSLRSSINHSLLGSRSRHCYAIICRAGRCICPVCTLIRWAYYRNGYFGGTARMSMALTSRRHPHHQPAACTDATAHPRRGHHRTTAHTSCSVRSPGKYRPHSRVRRPDTTAPGPRSRLPFLPSTRHTSCRHSTRVGRLAGKVMALLR